jgi:hypothetical protein
MSAGDNCSSACTTRDHVSWGACVRGKALRVEGCRSATGGSDRSRQKAWDAELALFRSAADQGIVPASTRTGDIRAALDHSDRTGVAFDAGSAA